MPDPIQRDPLCRRYPRRPRAFELGFLISLCMSAFAVACIAGIA